MTDIEDRLSAEDWNAHAEALLARGGTVTGPLLSPETCKAMAVAWDTAAFRSHVDMRRHGFGEGAYRYFDTPLPGVVQSLRTAAYRHLAPLANRMAEALGDPADYPAELDQMLARCHDAGQRRPTPLLLRYGAGDYNCLHQDLYGQVAFPLQMVIQLSRPGEDFDGGEFVLVENRPRMQSRASVLAPRQGEAAIFATARKPRRGAKGWTASTLRHGVSEITRGSRMTLGIIFHDAA